MINWLRERFCRHDLEEIQRVAYVDKRHPDNTPIAFEIVYKCKKCGYIKRVKFNK